MRSRLLACSCGLRHLWPEEEAAGAVISWEAVPVTGHALLSGGGARIAADTRRQEDPRAGQVGDVAGAEEPFGAFEQVVVVFVPAEPFAGAERLGEPVD